MNKERDCGCKGRRTCLWCENEFNLKPFAVSEELINNSYVYCPDCKLAWPGWDSTILETHPNHKGQSIPYPGILVMENFLTSEEAEKLINGMDDEKWDASQSGRRKQNYGPKCNFKRRKLAKGNFIGFPEFSLFVQNKLRAVPELENYFVIEQCSLEYHPCKGASIDPHIDDCWIWGDRVVTVNVIGNSFLTMIPYKGDETKYNLNLAPSIYRENIEKSAQNDFIVRIPMPARSLIVMYGEARFNWEHCVLRKDILERRVCIAYREFTPPYLQGGAHEDEGKEIMEISKQTVNF